MRPHSRRASRPGGRRRRRGAHGTRALASTALGHGVAIPRGRASDLRTPIAGVVRLAGNGLDFGAPDGVATTLFFFLLVPERATEEHLAMLSEIAQALGDGELRARLRAARDPAAFRGLLAQAPRLAAADEPQARDTRPASAPRIRESQRS
ncbi:MAG TPA: PTS sugar transporter subunit IIA [Caldimonas sp.]